MIKYDIKKFIPLVNNFLCDLVFKKPIPKLVCVGIAIILFIYVSTEEEEIQDYTIPIEVKYLYNKQLGILDKNIDNVNLTINAKRNRFFLIRAEAFSATVYVTNGNIGKNTYPIIIEDKISENINYRYSPQDIEVILEESIEKEVPVSVDFENIVPSGYLLSNYAVQPEIITIIGAKSIIENIDSVDSEMLDLNGITKYSERYLDINAPDFVNISDFNQVKVSLYIVKETETKLFTDLYPAIINLDRRFIVKNESSIVIEKLIIKGDKYNIDNISVGDISVILDLKNIKNVGYYSDLEIDLKFPNSMEVIKISPETINITVTDK